MNFPRNRSASNNPDESSATTPLLVDEDDDVSSHHDSNGNPRNSSWWSLILVAFRDEKGSPQSICIGMATLLVLGCTMGILSSPSENLHGRLYPTISNIIGYTYFCMWSISFYPQVITNFRQKSTRGLSPDFCGLNVLGFACYSIYNVSMFTSKSIQEQYRQRHHSNVTVQSNDVAFAVHAFALASITFLQIAFYGRSVRPTKYIGSIMAIILFVLFLYGMGMLFGVKSFSALNLLYLLSYVKVLVTLIKYIPQVVLNYQRQSTVGWSIWQILLDLSGGVLSTAQLVLDCANIGDFTGITGNIAKFCLGFVSIFFDIIFICQHYVLYPHPTNTIDVVEVEPIILVHDMLDNVALATEEDEHVALS